MKLLALSRLGVHVHPRPSGKLAAGQLSMAIFEDPQGVLHRQDFFDFLIVDEKHGVSALCFCYHNEPK
jgi:hypothetical protein